MVLPYFEGYQGVRLSGSQERQGAGKD